MWPITEMPASRSAATRRSVEPAPSTFTVSAPRFLHEADRVRDRRLVGHLERAERHVGHDERPRSSRGATARVSISISSTVTGVVESWPSTVIAAESPTSTMSTPAASASRALGASYAVTTAMRWPLRFRAPMSAGPCHRRSSIERHVVDEARPPHAGGDRQRRLSVEIRDGHVVDLDAGRPDNTARAAATGSAGSTEGAQARVERARNRQRARALLARTAGRCATTARGRRASRTVGTTRISRSRFKIADELPDHGHLLRVLLSEERDVRARRC